MHIQIIDLTADRNELLSEAAQLLHDAFRNRTEDWQDLESARQEALESLQDGRLSRVAVDGSGAVVGWIGGIPMYRGRVWEIHPLVVAAAHRRQGVGRALIRDLEEILRQKGAITLWVGSDARTLRPV